MVGIINGKYIVFARNSSVRCTISTGKTKTNGPLVIALMLAILKVYCNIGDIHSAYVRYIDI